jgi:hypothetical protein
MRGSCGKKQAASSTAILEKRRQDRETQQAAKVRRLEDENTALRERELIRESTTEDEDDPEIPVNFSCMPYSHTSLTVFA